MNFMKKFMRQLQPKFAQHLLAIALLLGSGMGSLRAMMNAGEFAAALEKQTTKHEAEQVALAAGETTETSATLLERQIKEKAELEAQRPRAAAIVSKPRPTLSPAEKYQNTLAFMFETNMAWDVTEYALKTELLQKDYYQCWQEIPERF